MVFFSNINSSGIDVGVQLVTHPDVKAVGFTGSIKGGRALYNLAAEREEPIPVFAEMGSINPVVVLPQAVKEKGEELAATYAKSITLGTGQFCTNPGLILGIESPELTEFANTLGRNIIEIEPSCMLHPNIAHAYESNKSRALAQSELNVMSDYTLDVEPNFAKQVVSKVSGDTFINNTTLHQEVFGPFSIIVACKDSEQLNQVISELEGQLTGTVISENNEIEDYSDTVNALKNRVGRIIFNGVPTGVEVCPAMLHGGPYPASTDSRFTAVGKDSIKRWVRPFSYQDWPDQLLPDALKNDNPLNILRTVNNELVDKK